MKNNKWKELGFYKLGLMPVRSGALGCLEYMLIIHEGLLSEYEHKKFITKKTRQEWIAYYKNGIDALTLAIKVLRERCEETQGFWKTIEDTQKKQFDIYAKIKAATIEKVKTEEQPSITPITLCGMTEYQIRLTIDGEIAARKELSLYHEHGIWPDNYLAFTTIDTLMKTSPFQTSDKKQSDGLEATLESMHKNYIALLQRQNANAQKASDDVAAKTSIFWPNE